MWRDRLSDKSNSFEELILQYKRKVSYDGETKRIKGGIPDW